MARADFNRKSLMTKPLKRRTLTFIVRIWVEYLDREKPELIGEIEAVSSKQRHYFRGINSLADVLSDHLQQARPGRAADDPFQEN